jgi:hypothetical protein
LEAFGSLERGDFKPIFKEKVAMIYALDTNTVSYILRSEGYED